MPQVTYAGARPELKGQKFNVPQEVLTNASGTSIADWIEEKVDSDACLLYTSPSPRDKRQSRMPSSA